VSKALVIAQNVNTQDIGALLAVARAEVQKREKASQNPIVQSPFFVSELSVHVAVCELDINAVAGVKG